MTMNSHQSAPRITDVVPANFLCDSRTMEKIAQSQLKDEKALYDLENNLSVLESRRRCLKDELATVKRLSSDAVAEQTRLRSSIPAHRSLLAYSPVRALPGEVLSEIFLYYVALSQTTQTTVFKEIVASLRIPVPILLVCRRWRTTALADPRLWSTIPLIGSGGREPFSPPLICGSPEERAAYWNTLQSRIERLSALSLHLLFHFTEHKDMGDLIYAISSLQTFIRLFSRANTISLDIQTFDAHIQRSNALLLELRSIMDDADIPHADGVHTARVDVDGDVFARKILSAMPNVEVLETRAVTIDRWFIDAPTAGYRLRCLHILTYWGQDAIPLVQLLDLLDHAPLLETLKVAEISITSSVGTLRVVTHMRLSTFHLASATADENDAVFSHLTLPALRSLSYVGDDYRPLSMPCPSNMAFLERSGCILESLSFRQWRVDETDLMVMLTIQQALITLQLNFFPDEDSGSKQPIPMAILAILEFLSLEYKGGSDRPLPALTFLTLVVLPHHLEAVARLVQSRSAEEAKKSRITALRKVDIQVHIMVRYRGDSEETFNDDEIVKDEHAALFKDFVRNGIDIHISYDRRR